MRTQSALLAGAALIALLTACDSVGGGIGNRRTNASTTTTTQNSAPASSETSGAPGTNPWQGPVPTAIHYPSQCPGATNAEIDAALQSNEPWVCYAATREAAGK